MREITVSAHHSSAGTRTVGVTAGLRGSLLPPETLSLFRLPLKLLYRLCIFSDLRLEIVDLRFLAVEQCLYLRLLARQFILERVQLRILILQGCFLLFYIKFIIFSSFFISNRIITI